MSTQPRELPKLPVLPKLPKVENQDSARENSVLDQPWRIAMLPEDEVPTIAVPSPDAEPPRKSPSLPWRPGDVARLKDDTPEGMMRYIATHSTGWWQEMAERALRDTEKARRMAQEAGWRPGQYWTLEVDIEAREKMRAREEARRQREQAERAREQAEKEAFAQRQMELLKKAGRAPRCEYIFTDGRGCRGPQVRGERWCHGHAKTMSYRPENLELLPMEDEQAVTVNLYRVTRSLLSGRITEKVVGLALWSIAIAAPCAKRINSHRGGAETPRKAKNDLPQMSADGRKPRTHHGGAETRRKTTRELPQINADRRRLKLKKGKEGEAAGVNPGMTRRKSFVSGVDTGGTPVVEQRQSRENALKRHCHRSHSRDLSTPPRSAGACSESLKMTGIGECGRKGTHARLSDEAQQKGHSPIERSGHRDVGTSEKQNLHSSAAPRLRGEIAAKAGRTRQYRRVKPLKSTDLHSHAQPMSRDGHL